MARRTMAPELSDSTAQQPLTRVECLALLIPGGSGRVAATMRAVPVIIPVTFVLVDDDVRFSSRHGIDIVHAIDNAVVAFETDQIGTSGRPRWHVHVTGVAGSLTSQSGALTFHLASEIMEGWRASG